MGRNLIQRLPVDQKLGNGDFAASASVEFVRVIVVNYNSGAHLARCLEALIQQTYPHFEALIIDNASTDNSFAGLPCDPRLRVTKLERNIGFAAANNLGFVDQKAEFVALLNPDAFPAFDWLERLVEAARNKPAVHMFGSLQVRDDNPAILDGAGDVYFFAGTAWRHGSMRPRGRVKMIREPFGPCAAAALIRSDWFALVGGFDERYFCYFEDVDLAFRLRLLGGRAMLVEKAVVRHVGSAASGSGSDFVTYHVARNQIWTFWKCMPLPLLILLLPCHALLVAGKFSKAVCSGRGHTFARAVGDALIGLPMIHASRRKVQHTRSASSLAVARAMTWSPISLGRRSARRR